MTPPASPRPIYSHRLRPNSRLRVLAAMFPEGHVGCIGRRAVSVGGDRVAYQWKDSVRIYRLSTGKAYNWAEGE